MPQSFTFPEIESAARRGAFSQAERHLGQSVGVEVETFTPEPVGGVRSETFAPNSVVGEQVSNVFMFPTRTLEPGEYDPSTRDPRPFLVPVNRPFDRGRGRPYADYWRSEESHQNAHQKRGYRRNQHYSRGFSGPLRKSNSIEIAPRQYSANYCDLSHLPDSIYNGE